MYHCSVLRFFNSIGVVLMPFVHFLLFQVPRSVRLPRLKNGMIKTTEISRAKMDPSEISNYSLYFLFFKPVYEMVQEYGCFE